MDLVGDKWTLRIVREMMMFERHRDNDFLAGGEGKTTDILVDRLRQLEAHGAVQKRPYQARSLRCEYHLTAKDR